MFGRPYFWFGKTPKFMGTCFVSTGFIYTKRTDIFVKFLLLKSYELLVFGSTFTFLRGKPSIFHGCIRSNQ